ncbi:MAG TPA: hypothetical protein VD833_13365 [Vicinamibacterales bacterium]|nr:hypothetical protein [Vicinamibacterales bacterium]
MIWRRPAGFLLLVAAALPWGAAESAPAQNGSAWRAGPAQPAGQGRLQGEEALVRVYDAILDARFDEVEAELQRACGTAPEEACDVLAATAIWWQIVLDPDSRRLDEEFATAVERAIRNTEAWSIRAPDNAEAWFYLGGAYAARVQWQVLRGEKLAAARDGRRIKQALEQAITLDPALEDAWFGIGMYRYYADVAPLAARILRFLLLLPGGNRDEGLEQMLRARDRGRLLEGEADYQLHLIYLWYEDDVPGALGLLRGLQQRYPGNPWFPARIAEIEDAYLHDLTASLASWRRLLALALERRVNVAAAAAARSRLHVAALLDRVHETDRALDVLAALVRARPDAPHGALALGYLRMAEAQDRLGHRAAALEAYALATATAPVPDVNRVAARARRGTRRTPDPGHAEAYRLSIEGLRLLEHDEGAAAEAALTRAVALNPREPVARYRYGLALQAGHNDGAALEQFELATRDADACPAPILANVYLHGARLHERAGHRDAAIEWYRAASTVFGVAAETRQAAARALARLQQ